MKRPLNELNPIVYFIYFIMTVGLMMFSIDIVSATVSFVAVTVVCIYFVGFSSLLKEYAGLILFGLVAAIINPLFVHRGQTILFYINSRPITLEATLYGICLALIILSVFMWFKLFYITFSSDGLQYVIGKYAPKTAVTISVIIRFIPMLWQREQTITENMTAIGKGRGIKNKLEIFSGVVSYALENSIETSDSMRARGYGISDRNNKTLFSKYKFRKSDLIFLLISIILFSAVIVFRLLFGGSNFYPSIRYESNIFPISTCIFYTLLLIFPVFLRRKTRARRDTK